MSMSPLRAAAVVFAGGAAGTLARHGLAEWMGSSSTWPWPTFVANGVGSLVLGLVVVWFSRPDDSLRLLLGTGVLGGFTTYSAFAVETDQLFRDDQLALALAYPVTTVVLGVVAAMIGMIIGRRVLR